MKTLLSAIALSIALPAVAHAQTAPTPPPAAEPEHECCCEKMNRPMACCEKQGDRADRPDGAPDPHAGHKMNH